MGRRRRQNAHLPRRVYLKHGRYWHVDRVNKWHDLGQTASEMYRELAMRADQVARPATLNAVFDRYLVDKLTLLAPRTQSDYRGYIENLRLVFGTAPPSEVTAGHVYDYRNKRAEKSVVQANRERSCLSAVFTAAVEWRIREGESLPAGPEDPGARARSVRDRLRVQRRLSACVTDAPMRDGPCDDHRPA
jgi:hypothetical protein